MGYKTGLCSVSFRCLSAEEIIAATQQADLTVIEWGSDIHAPCNDPDRLNAIAQLQKRSGITCCSYGTYFELGVTPFAELEGYIRAAKLLDTHILRLWCGNKGSAEYTIEEKKALFSTCKAAADMAARENVILCMECHGNTYTDTKESAYELMQTVNSAHFRMYWQPDPSRSTEENIAYAKLLCPYTEHLHVFHWKNREKYPLQDAAAIWKEYLACFGGDRVLLLEFMPDDQVETLRREAASLKEIAK